MIARSLLFVPGHNSKFMESAAKSNADILLPDVEDSVQPISNKQLSRDMILSFVNDKKFDGKLVFPRVNAPDSGELINDITQLAVRGIDGFMYPKARTGSDIYFFDKLLESVEAQKGFPIGTFKIIALIETIDTVHVNINDLDDLEKNLKTAKNLGFEGMLSLHPKELPLIHQYFSPSSKEIDNAKRIIELYNESELNGRGVALFGDELIGPPMVKDAKNLLNKWINK